MTPGEPCPRCRKTHPQPPLSCRTCGALVPVCAAKLDLDARLYHEKPCTLYPGILRACGPLDPTPKRKIPVQR